MAEGHPQQPFPDPRPDRPGGRQRVRQDQQRHRPRPGLAHGRFREFALRRDGIRLQTGRECALAVHKGPSTALWCAGGVHERGDPLQAF